MNERVAGIYIKVNKLYKLELLQVTDNGDAEETLYGDMVVAKTMH